MGFVKIVPHEVHPPCPVPHVTRNFITALPDFDLGTIWECDKCKRRYELVSVPARGSKGKWKLIVDQAGEAAPE